MYKPTPNDELRALCRASGETEEVLTARLGLGCREISRWEITQSRPRRAPLPHSESLYNENGLIR
ncbi:MAG: hypothetical protein ACI4PC_09680 [Oscillospiraceae bacterium]